LWAVSFEVQDRISRKAASIFERRSAVGRQDLDAWINSLKAGVRNHDADAIVARLGA